MHTAFTSGTASFFQPLRKSRLLKVNMDYVDAMNELNQLLIYIHLTTPVIFKIDEMHKDFYSQLSSMYPFHSFFIQKNNKLVLGEDASSLDLPKSSSSY